MSVLEWIIFIIFIVIGFVIAFLMGIRWERMKCPEYGGVFYISQDDSGKWISDIRFAFEDIESFVNANEVIFCIEKK